MSLKSKLYKTLRIVNDVNAIRKGRIGNRIGQNVTRQITRKVMQRLFK